jgi:hypothetical protein
MKRPAANLPGRGEKAPPVRERSPDARAGNSRKSGDMAAVAVISAKINQED